MSLSEEKGRELVLCVEASAVLAMFNACLAIGTARPGDSFLNDSFAADRVEQFAMSAEFVERSRCEFDPNLKQVIPYVVVASGGRVLRYVRSRSGGEGRLYDFHSIGIGGHINPCDEDASGSVAKTIENAARRELAEEIGLASADVGKLFSLGILSQDDDEVGRVHVGICLVAYVDALRASAAESAIDGGQLVGWYELKSDDRLERWSRILVDESLMLRTGA